MSAMDFISTRRQAPPVSLGSAFEHGLAPDGGLYVPRHFPTVAVDAIPAGATLPEVARTMLRGFAEGDPLAADLDAITAEAFAPPVPLTPLGAGTNARVLELFHGPTAAFKDFGARFLAASLQRITARAQAIGQAHPGAPTAPSPLTILVATSGDTGGAVAAAFHRRAGTRVVVLYPEGRVSPLQERQLTCWGDNVLSLRVAGAFDDCQRLVKRAFQDASLARAHRLSSANSINLGRLLPQACYYAHASHAVRRETGEAASFIIPAGNLGNACAAVWARQMGFPIARIVLAHNANRIVPDYFTTGHWQPRPSIATLASAMDVGDPSNMERLNALYPTAEAMRAALSVDAVEDAEIRARIVADHATYGRTWCPHTAVAAEVYARLDAGARARPWVIVATAHPAKFSDVVAPLVHEPIAMPPALERLLALPTHSVPIHADLGALAAALDAH